MVTVVRAVRLAVKAVVVDVVAVVSHCGAQAGHRTRVRGPMAVPNLRQHGR